MTDASRIITLYEEKEAAAGGLPYCDVRRTAELVASDLGVSYEVVRDVLSEHWAGAVN